MSLPRIPTLDIRRFTDPASKGDREACVAELGSAYRQWGFAGVRGHGIPEAQIAASYDVFERFFALPDEVKR
ncbi:MAG: 2-oxoglutarate and iron-dependent oxygenase domain-containing protein, partial [Pseudomonadota bacterium]|nr:2-oxoglutarate and iron-dependent oxygenase domain-containing protein [Pseudomonadota bacterium]